MPDKFAPLPGWVVPAFHLVFGWGGWLLLGVVGVLARRSARYRWAAAPLALVLLASLPLLAPATGLPSGFVPEALLPFAAPVRDGYEILFCILAVWLGTIWYRNNLGNEF